MSVRGLYREYRYAGEVYFSTSVQTGISRVTSNVNSCSYTQCVYLFPTLHSTRREFSTARKNPLVMVIFFPTLVFPPCSTEPQIGTPLHVGIPMFHVIDFFSWCPPPGCAAYHRVTGYDFSSHTPVHRYHHYQVETWPAKKLGSQWGIGTGTMLHFPQSEIFS